jgi:SAM-dependent methyltransferase
VPDDPPDVPSGIDLRDPVDAATWVREADAKRPWRALVRAAFADMLNDSLASVAGREAPPMLRVLELGGGPGLLAETLLRACAIERYTLLDFSQPMLDMCRARLGAHPALELVLGDFKADDWPQTVAGPFDAVVSMQAVHEIRHKRHVPGLYRQVHALLRPGGLLLVADHAPPDASPRMTSLHSTEEEQHAALASAGFVDVKTLLCVNGLYLCRGVRAP